MEKQGVLPVPVRRNRGMDVPSDSLEFHDLIQSHAQWTIKLGIGTLAKVACEQALSREGRRVPLHARACSQAMDKVQLY